MSQTLNDARPSAAANNHPDVLPCVADDGAVASWIFCRGCGYRLTGLSAPGLCPECARPIAESIRPSRVRSLSSRALRRLRSSADAIRVGAVLLILATAAGVIGQFLLAAFLTAAMLFAVSIGLLSLPALASRRSGETLWQRMQTPRAAILGIVVGIPVCVALAWVMYIAASRGGLERGGIETLFQFGLAAAFVEFILVLAMHPIVVWLQRVHDLLADCGNANLLENAATVERLLRRTQLICFLTALLGPILPPLLIVPALVLILWPLIALGVLCTTLLAVRREVKCAMAEALLREAEAEESAGVAGTD